MSAASFNFWDVDDSSSDDDDFQTPSSPDSSSASAALDTPSPTSYANKRTSRAVHAKHAHTPSITNIRLPVDMSDDDADDEQREEHKQQQPQPKQQSTIQEGEDERTDDDSSEEPEVVRFDEPGPLPPRPSTSPPASNTAPYSRLDKEPAEEKEEELRRPSSSGGIRPASVAAAAQKPLPLTPSPPPVPPRRSSQTFIPPLALTAGQSGAGMPHFPPPPSSVGRPTIAASPSASPPSSARSSYPVATFNLSAPSAPSSHPLPSSTASSFSAPFTPPQLATALPSTTSAHPAPPSSSSATAAATFASHLRHAFEPVSRQSTASVHSTKRLASLVKRLAQLDESYIQSTAKTASLEEAKRAKPLAGACADGVEAARRGWDELDGMLRVREQSGLSYCDRVMREVVLPLLEFYQEAEERRKRLVDDERRATAEMNRHTEEVARNLSLCVKLVNQAKQQLHEESESGGGGIGVGNMKLTLTKHFRQSVQTVTANAVKAARAYNDSIGAANSRQQRYVKEEIPALFGGLEAIERGRLTLMKDKMLHWTDLQIATLSQQLTQLQQARREMEQHMDVEASLQSYIAATLSQHSRTVGGLSTEPKPYVYQLGVSIRDMEEGRLEPPVPTAPTMSVGVFGVPLSVLMEREEERAAESDAPDGQPLVPRIVRACEERLCTPAALATEGLFRISIPKPQLDQLRTAIDREDYSVITQHPNPHAAAALLKDFLRSLPSPLLAADLYDDCVAAGMERGPGAVCDERAALAVLSRAGEYERRVLGVLGGIGARVVAEEAANRMGVDNLAIVFAPCLLRNPSADMATLLAFTKYEAKFTAALLRGIIAETQAGRERQGSVSMVELDFD